MAERPRPKWADLTMQSTREEVLAAVEEDEARTRESLAHMATVEFPEVPEGFEGCVMSKCGTVRARYGKIEEPVRLKRQRVAGEEDQSVPGWDFGA